MRKNRHFQHAVARDGALQELFDELGTLRGELDAAYVRFDVATEPELVDACVYEINAAQSRYNYQLRLIKERGGAAAFRVCGGKEGAVWA